MAEQRQLGAAGHTDRYGEAGEGDDHLAGRGERLVDEKGGDGKQGVEGSLPPRNLRVHLTGPRHTINDTGTIGLTQSRRIPLETVPEGPAASGGPLLAKRGLAL